VAISNSLVLLYKIAALRLLPWMACMQKMQEHFSVAMTVIYELIRDSLDLYHRYPRQTPDFDLWATCAVYCFGNFVGCRTGCDDVVNHGDVNIGRFWLVDKCVQDILPAFSGTQSRLTRRITNTPQSSSINRYV